MTDAAPIATPPTGAGGLPPDARPAVAQDLEAWALDVFERRRCSADLTRLSARARYCPRCGFDLTPGPVLAASPLDLSYGPPFVPDSPGPASSGPDVPGPANACSPLAGINGGAILAEWQRLQEPGASHAPLPPRGDATPWHGPQSKIVAGYANALFRLGWRYESHLGIGRNVSEAVRCYLKAARLGNPEAVARLAPRCAGDTPGSASSPPPGQEDRPTASD